MIAPITTTAIVLSIIIGSSNILKLPDNSAFMPGFPEQYYVIQDYRYGMNGGSDPTRSIIYTDLRYRVLGQAESRFFKILNEKNSGYTGITPYKQVRVQSARSLCGGLLVPVFVNRALPTQFSNYLAIYKRLIAEELNNVKSGLTFFGQPFIDELDNHITYLTLLVEVVASNPDSTVNAAYSLPNWTSAGATAANACIATMSKFRK